MSVKVYDETKIRAIAEKIREKTGGDETYTTEQMPSGIDSVFEAGQTEERIKFWNTFQKNGESNVNYYAAFAYEKYNDENYNPIHPIRCAAGSTGGQMMFYNANALTDTKVAIYAITNLTSAFGNCSSLKRIPLLSVREATTYSTAFSWCSALEEITFDGIIGQDLSFEHCKKLGHLSIENIIQHLSDTATGKTLTLSYDAMYGWWGDDPTEGVIGNSWYELIATKPNWTINLV